MFLPISALKTNITEDISIISNQLDGYWSKITPDKIIRSVAITDMKQKKSELVL